MTKDICIGLGLIFFSFVLSGPGQASETAPSIAPEPNRGNENIKLWIGNVLIERTVRQQYEIEKITISKRTYRSKYHKLDDTVEILACIKDSGDICILDAVRSFRDVFKEKRYKENTRDICPLTDEQMKHNFLYREKHFEQEIIEPGDSTETITDHERELYRFPVDSMKDQTNLRLAVDPDGNYNIFVYHITKVDRKWNSTNESTFVCDNKKRIVESHIVTGKIGDEPKSTMLQSGEGNDSVFILNSVQPPLIGPLGCVAEGKVKGDRISGSMVIVDKKAKTATDEEEKYTAHWDFTYSEPMGFVEDCLLFAKETLDRALRSSFKEFHLPDGACDRAELVECWFHDFENRIKNGIPPLTPNRSDCIDAWCGYSKHESDPWELESALYDWIGRALWEYEKLKYDCNLYGSCDRCFD